MRIINSDKIDLLLSRRNLTDESAILSVKEIVDNVRRRGDEAVFEYCKRFDNTDFNKTQIKVSKEEFEAAYAKVDEELLHSLKKAAANVLDYHRRTSRYGHMQECTGRHTGFIVRAVDRAGIYVPGGTAAYPSSVIMGVMPAVAAGVKEISIITPAKGGEIHPLTLVAAAECGIDNVYKVGGAQGIAALAFGTESIKKVDIIAGPGNIYVSLAKKEVYGLVGIDMIAGPSEILVICDNTADPSFVAADLLSQAEHDALSAAYAVTDSIEFAKKIADELQRQIQELPRKDIALSSIEKNGAIIVVKDLNEAAAISNKIAPEHLELMVKEPKKLLEKIDSAGAVFLGAYTPEAVGDYFAGPCHVLPTSGSARFFEVLSQDTFLKKISVVEYSKDALFEDAQHIIRLAESEGLAAHARSVKQRLKEK